MTQLPETEGHPDDHDLRDTVRAGRGPTIWALQQIYDNQAQYLGTVCHRPTHAELAQMAVLHGFRPALPVSADPVDEPLRAARHPDRREPRRAPVPQLRPRPELGPRAPAVSRPATGARRHCGPPALHGAAALAGTATPSQMVNVGASGAREASPWFEPDGDSVTWSSLYADALAAGRAGHPRRRLKGARQPSADRRGPNRVTAAITDSAERPGAGPSHAAVDGGRLRPANHKENPVPDS